MSYAAAATAARPAPVGSVARTAVANTASYTTTHPNNASNTPPPLPHPLYVNGVPASNAHVDKNDATDYHRYYYY